MHAVLAGRLLQLSVSARWFVELAASIGREFTLATNQVDFAVPKRFGLVYRDKDNTDKTPLCIHRAPLGTHERFIGFLIEHYAGNFPLWLAPEQVRVLTVGEEEPLVNYAQPLFDKKLWLVSSGYCSSGADAGAISERMRSRISDLRNRFEYVLLDLPPLNKYADAIMLGGTCDGIILVLRANSSRRDTALRSVADLKAHNVNVLGVALNQRKFSVPDSIYRRL
jgi:hypothetical protein